MQYDAPDYPITGRQRLTLAWLLCVAMVAYLLVGCNLQPPPTPGPWTEAREAKPTATAGTQPLSLLDASHSVFLIDVSGVTKGDDGKPVLAEWTATVWIGAAAPDHVLLVTAGHVCEPKAIYTFDDASGKTYYAPKVLIDDDNVDVCILTYPKAIGAAIALTDVEPAYGEHGDLIGAPHGMWGGGIAGVYDAVYTGRGAPSRGKCDDPEDPGLKILCDNTSEIITAAGAGEGASGSPILFDGRSIGLLSLVAQTPTPTFAQVVPWDVIAPLLDRAARM